MKGDLYFFQQNYTGITPSSQALLNNALITSLSF
jgi:hypothetical protein